jgi:hypothetical protein
LFSFAQTAPALVCLFGLNHRPLSHIAQVDKCKQTINSSLAKETTAQQKAPTSKVKQKDALRGACWCRELANVQLARRDGLGLARTAKHKADRHQHNNGTGECCRRGLAELSPLSYTLRLLRMLAAQVGRPTTVGAWRQQQQFLLKRITLADNITCKRTWNKLESGEICGVDIFKSDRRPFVCAPLQRLKLGGNRGR